MTKLTSTTKLLIDLGVGAAAGGVAYVLALPGPEAAQMAGARDTSVAHDPGEGERHPVNREPPGRSPTISPPAAPATIVDAGESIEERRSMLTLRNEVIRVSSEDMHRRGASVLACVAGLSFAAPEKIRFAVDVVSTPQEATIRQWRFVEIADGEPLPESFAACAVRAFGGGQRLVPPKDFSFPSYIGELLILYTIPASSSGSSG
jgi:hypothetical protein